MFDLASDALADKILPYLLQAATVFYRNKIYLLMILTGLFFIVIGICTSIYSKAFSKKKKTISRANNEKYLRYIETITNRYPFKILSDKLSNSIAYFMFNENTQRSIVAIFTVILPVVGILLYSTLNMVLNLWYTKLITFALCIMVPYYVFTLVTDYMKYSLKLKIPLLIDSFRSSFVSNNRIKPALQDCCSNIDKRLGRIMLRVSDSSDLNESLCAIRERINDTWFNIFVVLLVNYRENGGELIKQLYKLNKTITRYNNIEKKKNRRLIWYEFFTLAASIFSLPAILLINKMILGADVTLYYDAAASFGRIVIYSFSALLIVRLLRRM